MKTKLEILGQLLQDNYGISLEEVCNEHTPTVDCVLEELHNTSDRYANLDVELDHAITSYLEYEIGNIDLMVDISDIDFDVVRTADALREELDENRAFEQDVIYYATAIEYLANNDPSLNESLELAGELGYACDYLNSEVLASLLKSQEYMDDFEEHYSEIDDIFTTLDE